MASSQIIIFAIIATSIATYISRFMGALTSEKVSVKSKIFKWFNFLKNENAFNGENLLCVWYIIVWKIETRYGKYVQ